MTQHEEAGNLRDGLRQIGSLDRTRKLRKVFLFAVLLLGVKVLVQILSEYRWYFPANFDAAFLIGRRESFAGLYSAAFYTHVVTGPVVILLGSFLMFSGGKPRFRRWHRPAGRLQMMIVLVAVVPSGLVMAPQSLAGPIAVYGFMALAMATAIAAVATVYFAITRKFQSHQRWATRCYILLCSPLLLRLIAGATIVTHSEADWIYRLNAWVSWLVPIVVYEIYWRSVAVVRTEALPDSHHTVREALQ